MRKDIHEVNRLTQWGIAVAIIACFSMVAIIFTMDFTFLRHLELGHNSIWPLRFFLLGIALFFTALICRRFIRFLAIHLNHKFWRRFTHIPALGTFKEAQPKYFNPQNKIPHAVLLIHGFTASAQQFDLLAEKLRGANISFYAPNLLGFGLDTTQFLQLIRCEDWFRDVLERYDQLNMLAEEISIVGHSMGGLLAAYVAQNRKVKHLVLSAPAFFSMPDDLRYRPLVMTPIWSALYQWLVPYMPKSMRNGRRSTLDTLDGKGTKKSFQYLALPIDCVAQIFKMQDEVDIRKAHYQSLTVLYGEQDLTINNSKLVSLLQDNKVSFKQEIFKNCAHNIFEDLEKEQVCAAVMSSLT